jgi:hypothetical protein
MLPHHERRLDAEIAERYGPAAPSSKSRRRGGPTAPGPPSTCALREQRTGEITGR